jgi:hypothetical protein
MVFRILLLVIFLQGGTLQAGMAVAQHEITIWAVGSRSHRLYHCPKSRWYGGSAHNFSTQEPVGDRQTK